MGAVRQFCAVLPIPGAYTWWELHWFAGLLELCKKCLGLEQELMASLTGGFFSSITEKMCQQALFQLALKRIIKSSCRHNPIKNQYSWITFCTLYSMLTTGNVVIRMCCTSNLPPGQPLPLGAKCCQFWKIHCFIVFCPFLCSEKGQKQRKVTDMEIVSIERKTIEAMVDEKLIMNGLGWWTDQS